ncbi:chorismate mutase [Streptomyces sp. NPDC057011]|uniref:chorismate mutase n=1 Tax=unclassified Streptomyces TaxID=2593676 RepID=UPI00362B015B
MTTDDDPPPPDKEMHMTQRRLSPAAPTDAESVIAGLRSSIDVLDAQILELLERRQGLSESVQHARISSGGRRTELGRENVIIKRYADRLGRPGGTMALALLEFCRGSTAVRSGGAAA